MLARSGFQQAEVSTSLPTAWASVELARLPGIPANVLHRCVWRVGPVTTGGHATERQASPSQRRAMSLNPSLPPYHTISRYIR